MTDEQLLGQTISGDESAFRVLYQRHREPVYRFAYRLTSNREHAEDIAHDCFIGLLERPESFDPNRGELRTYLYGAVRNLANKHFRRTARDLPGGEVSEVAAPDQEMRPLTGLLQNERARAVQSAIAALPALQREALILFEYEELSLEQIAAVVEADISAVKSRLHRARQNLKKELAPLFTANPESKQLEEAMR
jgi:RNA polymerase sigma-70 factor (ECF subfamily)